MLGMSIGLGEGVEYQFRSVFTPPAFSPLDLSPVLWLDASQGTLKTGGAAAGIGDPVATWQDRTTNAKNATQATTSKQGTLSVKGVLLDGSDDGMSTPLNLIVPYTIIVVETPGAAFGFRRTIQSNTYNRVLSASRTNSNSVFLGTTVSSYFVSDLATHFLCLRVDGSGSKYEMDGVDHTAFPLVTADWGVVCLGAVGTNGSETANTTLFTVMAFASRLTDDQVASLRTYSQAHYEAP